MLHMIFVIVRLDDVQKDCITLQQLSVIFLYFLQNIKYTVVVECCSGVGSIEKVKVII